MAERYLLSGDVASQLGARGVAQIWRPLLMTGGILHFCTPTLPRRRPSDNDKGSNIELSLPDPSGALGGRSPLGRPLCLGDVLWNWNLIPAILISSSYLSINCSASSRWIGARNETLFCIYYSILQATWRHLRQSLCSLWSYSWCFKDVQCSWVDYLKTDKHDDLQMNNLRFLRLPSVKMG